MGLLGNLIKSSGIYALAALIAPMVTLVLTPFLAHHLSPTDYGVLTLLNAGIALAAAVMHLGQGDALLRAYNFDYTSPRERREVIVTAVVMLAIVSTFLAAMVGLMAPAVAAFVLGRSSLSILISLTAVIVLAYGLAVPGLAWLRAADRPFFYSVLTIGNALLVLIGTVILVGLFHLGVTGALVATAAGYFSVVVCTIPIMLLGGAIRVRPDIARSLLAFGLPLVLGSAATWALQLSDRYLLGLMRSLAETATYAVGYTLGSGLIVVIIRPFLLAWPTTMYAIAQKQNAGELFRLMFRWFSLTLLFGAFGLSLAGRILLDWLFPVAYRSAAPIIPVVAAALVFFGTYSLFVTGANLERKTWLMAVYTTVAAGVNVAANLLLIPRFGGLGAAISTLVAYAALAGMAYGGSQLIHPIPFEVGRFLTAALATAALYLGSDAVSGLLGPRWAWSARVIALIVCGAFLIWIGRGNDGGFGNWPPLLGNWRRVRAERTPPRPARVCMHVLGTARSDVRVMREATALAQTGLKVSVVDIEHDRSRPREEELIGLRFRHVMMSSRRIQHYEPTYPVRWLAFKVARMLRGALVVIRTPADVYHAHDLTALPPCYVAARLRCKPLIYDAHELPLVDPHIVARPLLKALSTALLKTMLSRCTGVITVSRPLAADLQRRYGGPTPAVVRNVPHYHSPAPSDRIRQGLGLSPKTRIVLYQGGLHVNRGLDAAVHAAKYLEPSSVLVFMGQGQARNELQAMTDREGVADKVKFLPAVPYEELLAWTASADIGLLINTPGFSPNVRVGLPNKLFEYLMAGVPVFASPLEAVVDVLMTYRVGRVARSLEPIEIGCALNAMLADREALAEMRRNALMAAQRELRWDVESHRLVDIYDGIVNGRPG